MMLEAFLPSFLAGFSVTLFVLVLQFLAKYQDDIFGKGFSGIIIAKLFLYAGANLSVLAFPIAVLISSLMTMGSLGEKYELAALKSAGISLFRIILPMGVFAAVIAGISLWFSLEVVPAANLKLYSLIFDLGQAKPEFSLKPGVFYKGINGFSIRCTHRSESGTLYDVQIYDHSQNRGNTMVILADSAKIEINQAYLFMKMRMYHGTKYEEMKPEPGKKDNHAYSRFSFDTLYHKFDMSDFGLKRTDEKLFTSHQYMMKIGQLNHYIDSLKSVPKTIKTEALNYTEPFLHYKERFPNPETLATKAVPNDVLQYFNPDKAELIRKRATASMRSLKNYYEFNIVKINQEYENNRKFLIEWHKKFAYPIVVVIMLFIGAPLGAIIRKGGMGLPTVVSIGFFILFYALMTTGNKIAKQGTVAVWFGVWLPVIVMAPMAVYITYQSMTDSRLFDIGAWKSLFRRKS
jgi:lipopolysaccharide export system permease protein